MSDLRPDAPPRADSRRFRGLWRAAAGMVVVVLLVLAGLWIDRKPIARGYITRTLATAGVPARYTLAELAPGHQRLTNVVLGNPARPDLVADWIETETSIGVHGARLTGLRAGHVRLRGTMADGHLSLGVIDRLLPASSGKPFVLPAIDLDIADGRMRLVTPAGIVGLKMAGAGRLDDGFRGTVAAVSHRIAAGHCAGMQVAAALTVAVRSGKPRLSGPVRAEHVDCGAGRVQGVAADLDVTLAAGLDRWTGKATLMAGPIAARGYAAAGAKGEITFDGSARGTEGHVAATFARSHAALGAAATIAVAGTYRIGSAVAFDGTVGADGAALAPAVIKRIADVGSAGSATPLAPLVRAATHATAAALRDLDGKAMVSIAVHDGKGALHIAAARIASASGMRATIGGGAGVRIDWPSGATTIDGDLVLAGGGLPGIRASLRQAAARDPVRGVATVDPYAADGARLAMTPVAFSAGAAGVRITARATVSGPVGNGRIEALSLPIDAIWDGKAGLTIDGRCTPVGFDRLVLSGLVLGATRVELCPVDGALVRLADGRLRGGAMLAGLRIAGRLGSSPVSLAADKAILRIEGTGVAIDGVHLLLGPADRQTRLDIASLSGTVAGGVIAGSFTGGAGQIGAVPLLLSNAAGHWRVAGCALSLTGTLAVADAGTPARFEPLAAHDVTLSLADGKIAAAGVLYEPTKNVKVAEVAIRHDLGTGDGTADLTVPALAFTEAFQPNLLTPLTYGVIAEVRGTLTGAGHIAWSDAGVTSTGHFRTGDIDLAAAFGPVTGLAGEIVFTDLLSLQSAPGQVATVRTINPGIAVTDGRIVYQTYPGGRILVNSGRWPFAGGALTLDPTFLDFGAPSDRRITFRVDGAAADQFLQQFDFKNLDATGVFDGVLPMIFDDSGGRIENGTLTVRGGGGSIAYVGDLTQKDLGFWGNLAFQALKSLRYQRLSITMNGPLSGEMVTAVRFAGVSQGAGAKSNFLIRRLQRLPLIFNVTIRAPFRGLLDTAAGFYDPKLLLRRNLPALIKEQERQDAAAAGGGKAPTPTPTATPTLLPRSPTPIQPPASRTVP